MRARLVTANIKSNPLMRQSYVDADIAAVRLLGDVILWQEIAPQRYKDTLHTLMPNRAHVALGTEVPITYKPWQWRPATEQELPDFSNAPDDLFPRGVTVTGAIRMHGARKRVTPVRYVTYAILTSVNGTGPIVVWMNTHMISGAWSNRHLLTREWRRARWREHFSKQQRLVTYFTSKGLTVIGGGDMNRGDSMPKFSFKQRWLAQGGIDHLYCIEPDGGTRVALNEMRSVPGLHTDHKPRVASLTVKKAS